MNRLFYKIGKWIIILTDIILLIIIFANFYPFTFIVKTFSGDCSYCVDWMLEFLLYIALIIGITYFYINEFSKIANGKYGQNKRTDLSLKMFFVSIIFLVIAFVFTFGKGGSWWEVDFLLFGVAPSSLIFAVSTILLIINKYKRHKNILLQEGLIK